MTAPDAAGWLPITEQQRDGSRYIGGWWRGEDWIVAPVEWKRHPFKPRGLYGWHICDIGAITFIAVAEPTHYLAVDMGALPAPPEGEG